ncbi:MAG TPA: flagellar basal body-associated FliL family protein [Pirellulales bacterium]|jgi:flagellar FliL protein|nr:flagellar basal body-associated FliL family protein [Pirellulales bacterium]
MSEAAKPAPEAAAPTAAKGLSKIEIIGFLGVVIIAQIVLAFMFIPKGGSTAAAAAPTAARKMEEAGDKAKEKKGDEKAADKEGHEGDAEHEDFQEVCLGKFSLTSFDPTSNTTLVIDFQLYGTVPMEHKEGAEAAPAGGHGHGAPKGPVSDDPDPSTKFGKLFKKNKHRIRDQVIKIIRTAEMSDLTDPGLGLIKRQILAKTNALLGDPMLKEVVFSDFAVIEQ